MTSFVPPMTMADFLQASRGTWLNRRSIHHLDHHLVGKQPQKGGSKR